MTNIFLRVLNKYSSFANKYPLPTNAATGFVIATVGDAVCQKYFDRKKNDVGKFVDNEWNATRSLELGLIRTSVITPFIHFWYPFLERACPGASVLRVVGRVVLDQSIGAPITITMVFLSHSLLRGDLANSIDRLQRQFFVTYTTGLRYWPIVHSINFSVVPMMHRSLFAHFASVYWMAVLSYYSNMEVNGSDEMNVALIDMQQCVAEGNV